MSMTKKQYKDAVVKTLTARAKLESKRFLKEKTRAERLAHGYTARVLDDLARWFKIIN